MLKGAEEDKTKDCLGTPTHSLVGNFPDPLSTPLRGTIPVNNKRYQNMGAKWSWG